MDKELIDKAWACLPREFKEEVRRIGNILNKDASAMFGTIGQLSHKHLDLFVKLFGYHNLTSDAEGEEEMLYVSRKRVQELYKGYFAERDNEEKGSVNKFSLSARIAMLEELFCSKCLPDSSEVKRTLSENLSEPKPVEPEEEIRKSRTSPEDGGSWHASMIGSGAATAVLNDSSDDRRLTIAAMAMQGILSNPTAVNGPKLIDGDEKILAEWSLRFADALIAEAKKGGKNE